MKAETRTSVKENSDQGRTLILFFLACLLYLVIDIPISFAQGTASSTNNIISAIQKGQYSEALRLCDLALSRSPSNVQLWTLKGMAFSRASQPAQALSAYRHALKLSPVYLAALEGAAEIEYRNGDQATIRDLKQILKLRPSDPITHGMLAVLEYRGKDCTAAVADFQASGPALNAQPVALTQFGACLAELKRYDEALQPLQQALTLRPESHEARYNVALVQLMAKHGSDALQTLTPAIEGESPDERCLGLASAIYESENNTPRAVELLRKAILLNPKNVGNYLDFAMIAFAHNSSSVGIDMLNTGISQMPKSAELYLARGVLYGQDREYDKAMADFERANALNPKLSIAETAQGVAHTQSQNIEVAIQSFRAQIRKSPKDALAHYLLAEALSEKDASPGSANFEEAIRVAKRATELNPTLTNAYDLLASLYLQAGHTQFAADACRAALRQNPEDQQAVYHLILASRSSGNKQDIAALVKQLEKLRTEERIRKSREINYKLVEQPSTEN